MATGVSVNPAPIGAPVTMYPGLPPHQPFSTPAMSAVPPRLPAHHNPPHALRRSMDIDQEPVQIQPPRQSLPSIHEALGNDNPLPYPGPSPSGPPPHSHPPSNLLSRPSAEGPAGPPNPFSVNNSNSAPFMRESQYHPQQGSTAAADPAGASMVSLSTQDSRKHSVHSLSGKSPTSSSKTAPTSISTTQSSAPYEYNGPTSAVASPNGYGPYPQSYSWQQSQQPAPYDSRYNGSSWKTNVDAMRNDEKVRSGMGMSQPHNDSVKRQFDSYDVESSLTEIIDGSTKTLDFSRHYAALAHQNQRSGPILGTLPSLHELDDLIQQQQRNHEALLRIRNAVVSQEHALAEQRVQQRQGKVVENGYDDEHSGLYQDGFKSPSGFTGGDAKKRRGKAAPPGRCHSCNRAETPEWRRGPDGARTLCNACGLHYAKLTRKMGAKQVAQLGSNIKPKGLDSTSPAHR